MSLSVLFDLTCTFAALCLIGYDALVCQRIRPGFNMAIMMLLLSAIFLNTAIADRGSIWFAAVGIVLGFVGAVNLRQNPEPVNPKHAKVHFMLCTLGIVTVCGYTAAVLIPKVSDAVTTAFKLRSAQAQTHQAVAVAPPKTEQHTTARPVHSTKTVNKHARHAATKQAHKVQK